MKTLSHVQLTYPEPGVAFLTLDVAGRSANMLSRDVLNELSDCLDQIEQQAEIGAIVIGSAKTDSFCVGADLTELQKNIDMSRQETVDYFQFGKNLFRRLSQINAVTVSAVNGICVGGGAELAIWCDFCVASDQPKTRFGFPEATLGMLPAWGGTVRAVQIAGIEYSSNLLSIGNLISAEEAKAAGLVYGVCDGDKLLDHALELARSFAKSEQLRKRREHFAQPKPISAAHQDQLERQVMELRQLPKDSHNSEIELLELLQQCELLPIPNALQLESVAMSRLFGSPENRALLNLYFLKQQVRQDTGIDGSGNLSANAKPVHISKVGIAGAGTMGQEIAIANLKKRFSLVVADIDRATLDAGEEAIRQSGTIAVDDIERLSTTLELEALSDCEIVIETIVENQKTKQSFYEKLEPAMDGVACLLSNTSTIPITKLAEKLARPAQFCGMHFFHPVAERPLLEIIRGEQTSDATIATAFEYGKRLGKFPIVVGDSPGFLVNRLLFPYVNEALKLFEEGASLRQIDQAAVEFGMPYGPISHFDRVGLDTAVYAGGTIYMHYFRRMAVTPILPKLVKAKRLGIKTGKGFYSYENPERVAQDDPTLLDTVGQYLQPSPTKFSPEQIVMRLFLPVLVEATMILEEGVARSAGDIDLGMMLGLGFPKYRGGILWWADQVGAVEILKGLESLSDLGPRYEPTQMMRQLAEEGGRYYD